MTKPFDALDETFDIAPSETVKVEVSNTPEGGCAKRQDQIKNVSQDIEKDYTYARSQLYNIVEKMQESLDGAMEVAQQSEHPRAYEVVFNGARHAADTIEKLTDLHKKMKDITKDEAKPAAAGPNVQNNMFVGSTAELMQMLKENK